MKNLIYWGTVQATAASFTWDEERGGWTDGENFYRDAGRQFSVEDAPVTPNVDRRVTVLAFRNRFTKAEKVALEMAALDNPSGTLAQRQMAASIRADMKDTDAATFIDLGRPDTRQGVIDLEAGGLLAQGRALEILDAEIQEIERYKGA